MARNKFLVSLIISAVVSITLISLFYINAFHSTNLRLSDKLYSFQKPLSEIIVVAIDDKSIQEIGRWPWSRDVYASALDKLKDASIIGFDVSFFEKSDSDQLLQNKTAELKDKIVMVSECTFENEKCTLMKPIFQIQSGYANIFVERDIARSLPMQIDDEKAFSSIIAEKYGVKTENKKILISFSKHETVSFSDLINNRTNNDFKDKIVLIGTTAKDLHDEKNTPLGMLSGVEIHASAVQTILTGKSLNYGNNILLILTILLLSFLISILLYKLRLTYALISSIILLGAYFIMAIFAFDSGIILNLFYPFLSLILTFVFVIIFYYLIEAREKKWVSELFGKYVSPSVADELIRKGKSAVDLKGERKTVSILFADIRGFTSFSEKNSPETVVSMLNRYHGKMTDIIFKYQGTLDKYVGDEIMATFNVPLDLKDHALASVQTAIEMQKASKEMNTQFRYGIGITTGSVIVGNIGSKKRMDYTVIGDSVNLAARLCSQAKADQILLSEEAYQLVKDKIKTRSIGEIAVKGKEKPVKVYEVVY